MKLSISQGTEQSQGKKHLVQMVNSGEAEKLCCDGEHIKTRAGDKTLQAVLEDRTYAMHPHIFYRRETVMKKIRFTPVSI